MKQEFYNSIFDLIMTENNSSKLKTVLISFLLLLPSVPLGMLVVVFLVAGPVQIWAEQREGSNFLGALVWWVLFFSLYIGYFVLLVTRKRFKVHDAVKVLYFILPVAVLFAGFVIVFVKPYARRISCPLIPVSGENPPKEVEAYIWEKYFWSKANDTYLCETRSDANGF